MGPSYVGTMSVCTELLPLLQTLGRTWSLICGAVIWVIWLCRNAWVFQDHQWSNTHLCQVLLDFILDLGCATSAQVLWTKQSNPWRFLELVGGFDYSGNQVETSASR